MALGPTHSDDAIWGVTALVRQLPEMSPEEYQAMADYFNEMQKKKSQEAENGVSGEHIH